MSSCSEHRLFWFLIAILVWSAAMRVQLGRIAREDFDAPASCSYFTGQPILDVELGYPADCFRSVVQHGTPGNLAHNIKVFRFNTYMDFVFIGLYGTAFVLFALVDRSRWSNWVIGLISVSAVFDILENWRILKGLSDLLISGQAQGLLPRSFSLIKWTALAFTLACLGALVWSWVEPGRRVLSRLLSATLFAAAVLTLAGLKIPAAMTYAGYCLALVFVLSIVRFLPCRLESILRWIEWAYLMRFQVLAALILAVGLPLAYHVIPSLFIGLFDGRGFWSFSFVVWAAFQLAWTIMVTCRLVVVYGGARFFSVQTSEADSRQPAQSVKPVRSGTVVAFGLLALPFVIVLYVGTADPGGAYKTLAALLGLALAIGVLALTASLHFAIEPQSRSSAAAVFPSLGFLRETSGTTQSFFWKWVGSSLKRLPPDLTEGILDGVRLRSGHEMAAIALAVFLVLYLAVGTFFSPSWSDPEHQPAAMFFLLSVLTVFTWLLSGAAFFLDKTRLPVFTTLLAVSLLTGLVRTDHEFSITPRVAGDARALPPSEVIHSWEKGLRHQDSKAITIVATAGGGIRAAAWTAEVMTRLQEHCGKKLSSSVVLVSSVSGGSVGSMFVVGPYSSTNGDYPVTDADLKSIRFNASRSSLSAVGWGLAYPDLTRIAPLVGALVPQTLDRGWSLENAWATAWRGAGQTQPFLGTWRNDVQAGTRPAVIFNATASENGERFLIASTDSTGEGTVRFFDLFPESDIRVATAARLSATFPYVSPLARPSAGPTAKAYHVGDGGYYDNSGLLSAVEWLRNAGDAVQRYQVLLILIDAKPGTPKAGSSWSWQKQIIGPIETLLHVRTSSQQLRNSIELKMASDYLAAQKPKVEVIAAPFLFSSDSPSPLSWHLTDKQIQEIGSSWGDDQNVKSRRLVYDTLTCDPDTK